MLTRDEIDGYRRRLVALGVRLSGEMERLEEDAGHGLGGEAGGGLGDTPLHPADLGNAAYEAEMDRALLGNEQTLLQECADALARIEAGTFGVCEQCKKEIARRLEVAPYIRHCIDCARQFQAGPGGR